MHQFIYLLIFNPLKYKVDNSIRLVSICMGYSIKMKRVNFLLLLLLCVELSFVILYFESYLDFYSIRVDLG